MSKSEDNSENLELKDGDDSGSVPDGVRFQVFIDGLGVCAAPDCNERSVHHRTKLAECAHIIPRRVGSHPREDYTTPLSERNKEPNLLYLCERHHKVVDNVEHANTYTVDVLSKWKRTHEEWAKSVTKESPYLPSALKEALLSMGKSLAGEATKNNQTLNQIIELCRSLILRNRVPESQILLAQISTLAIETNDANTIYLIDYLNARLLRAKQKITEAKQALLEIINSGNTRSEAMAEYIELCRAAPEPNDDSQKVERLLRELDPENLHLTVLDLIQNSENSPVSISDLALSSTENRRFYEQVLTHNCATLDAAGEKIERDLLVQKWSEEIDISPKPLLLQAAFTSVDTLRVGSSDPKEVIKSIEAINYIKSQLSERDPLSPKDKLMWGFHEFRILLHFCRISGETGRIESCWREILSTLENCYFDTFVYAQLGELIQHAPLSADEWKALYSKIKSSSVIPTDEFIDILFLKGIHQAELDEELTELLDNYGNVSTRSLWSSRHAFNIDQITRDLREKDSQAFSIAYLKSVQSKHPEGTIELCDRLLDGSDYTIELLFIKLTSLKDLDRKDECLNVIRSIPLDDVYLFGVELVSNITFGWKQWDLFIQSSNRLLDINPTPDLHARLAMAYANSYDDTNAIVHAKIALGNIPELDARYSQNTLRILIESLQLKGKQNDACREFEQYEGYMRNFHILMLGADTYLKSSLDERDERALDLILQGFRILENIDDDVYLSTYLVTLDLANSGRIDLRNKKDVGDGDFIKVDGIPKWFYLGRKEDSMGAIPVAEHSDNYRALIGRRLNDPVEWPADRFTGATAGRKISSILSPEAFLCHRSHEAMDSAAKSGDKPIWQVNILSDDDSIDIENLRNFSTSISKDSDNFFEMYVKDSLPFSFLCKNEGGPIQAIGRISRAGRGFIKCNNGTGQQIEDQAQTAQSALDGATCYLDGLAALVLTESSLLEKVCSSIKKVGVCTSVVRLFREEAKSLESSRGSVGRAAFVDHRMQFKPTDEHAERSLRQSFLDAADFLDGLPIKKIGKPFVRSEALRDWDEVLPNYIMDPLRNAQREGAVLMTEDAILQDVLRLSGESNPPKSFSSLSLLRILAESGKIEWDHYYKYFGRLSQLRFHLLPITVDEIMRAVLQPIGGDLVVMRPSNLELLNLNYTLSKENGVDDRTLVAILGQFFARVVKDESISKEIADEVFSIALVRTLSRSERTALRHPVLALCRHIVNSGIYSGRMCDEKLEILRLQVTQFFGDYDPLVQALPSLLRVT
ncbi:MAG: hypothetical protein ABI600_00680 [Luteolibacter sp.]